MPQAPGAVLAWAWAWTVASAAPTAAAGGFSCEVNYGEGRGDWRTLWSEEEKLWCCKHRGLACPTTSLPLFDCDAGFRNWKDGWSKAKRAYCCRHHDRGCEVGAEAVAPAPAVKPRPPTPEELAQLQAAEVARAAEVGSCGVSAVLDDFGGFREPRTLQPTCGKQLTTNCSISYGSMKCPAGCDFLAPNHRFVCVFECVSADECSASNSNRAFPDPATGLCTPCAVVGCKMCEAADRCAQCHSGFVLSADGRSCDFALDRVTRPDLVILAFKILVVFLVGLAGIWRILKGAHPLRQENFVAIQKARLHRHLCKVQDWCLGSNRRVRWFYPLTVNLQRVHILGVGLPLFYNSIFFIGSIALMFTVGTWLVFSGSPLSFALSATDRSAVASAAVALPTRAPAVVFSPLVHCGTSSAPDIMRQVREFAVTNFYLIGGLYVMTFLASLWHGRRQLQASVEYDAHNKTMADYALRVTGMRRSMTDESKLKDIFQEAVRKACPDANQEHGLQIFGVSICYDYRAVWSQVDAMKDRFMERAEVLHQQQSLAASKNGQPGEGFVGVEHTSAQDEATMEQQRLEDRKQAKAWFDEDSSERLHSTGEVFLVFRHHRDMNTVYEHRVEVAKRLHSLSASEDFMLEFNKVFSEPPSINWWHLSVTGEERNKNVRNAMIKILGVITVVQLLIVMPYAHFILEPYSTIGSAAGGAKMQLAGVILGNVNMFVSLQIFFTAYGLGFHRKDGMDMMILCANTTLVMVNTFFNIVMTSVMVFSQNDEGLGPAIFLNMHNLVAIAVEGDVAESIYRLMMPGTFFVGPLTCIVMAGVVPYVWNSLLMKIIYVWRCLPDGLLNVLKVFLPWAADLSLDHYPFRRAERGFEPMEIGISWDYTSLIVTPTVCFSMLFFVSPYVWQTFAMMTGSYVFYFGFCRYQHFRFCKACYYTTNRLDTMANFLWGIPLSVIAAACCVWALRSGVLAPGAPVPVKSALVGMAFVISLLSWVLAYWRLLDPWRQVDAVEKDTATFEAVKSDLLYSWFNCNPVFALKCEHYLKDASQGEIVPTGRTAASGADESTPSPLKVEIISARDLRRSDWLPTMGSTDPRCVVEVMHKPLARLETSTHPHSQSPVWDYSGELPQYADGDSLIFSVFDKDLLRRDDLVGSVTLSPEQLRQGFDGELELGAGRRGHPSFLKVRIHVPQVPLPETRIHISGATGLRDADWVTRSDPYCVCHVAKRPDVQIVTPVASDKQKPSWDVRTGLVLQPGDELIFTVLDKDMLRKGDVLGTARLSAEQVRKGFKGELPLEQAGKGVNATLKLSIRPPPREQRASATKVRRELRHPIACGEDPNQVRFFEIGKEYLFVKADKMRLVREDLRDSFELETWLELLLNVWGRVSNPFWEKITKLPDFKKVATLDVSPRAGSRDVLLMSTPNSP